MAEAAIKLPKEKLAEGLSTLSFGEIKEAMDSPDILELVLAYSDIYKPKEHLNIAADLETISL